MQYETIKVETALMPAYYKDFHCIMGACQDNCCDDSWKIWFSKKDYLTVKRAPKSPELEEEMRKGMRRLREPGQMYAEFCITEWGRCAFHTPEGLCALQLECGEETLPKVCRVFPRTELYTPHAREFSLSPACEGVVALLWDLPQGIDFIEEPLHPKDVRYSQPENAAAARFAPIRSLFIDVLQERSLKLPQRLLLLGLLTQQFQGLDWEDEAALDGWLERAVVLLHDPSVAGELEKLPHDRQLFLSNGVRVLIDAFIRGKMLLRNELLEAISENWWEQDMRKFIIQGDRYQALEEKLDELLGHSEYFFENIMVTLAFHLKFPLLSSPEELWKSYVNLCNLYSFYRFASVCACQKEVSRTRLTHVIVQVSRALLHNSTRQANLREELFKNDSATLAHMAILVGG